MRPCAPLQHLNLIGEDPLSKWIQFFGTLRVCMALKTLWCCGNASLPEQSALRAMHTLNPHQNHTCLLRGLYPIHLICLYVDQGLTRGIRRKFLPAAAMIVTLIVYGCSMAGAQANLAQWNPGILGITGKLLLWARNSCIVLTLRDRNKKETKKVLLQLLII